MPLFVRLLISSLSDFVIVGGGCLTTAMVATGNATMPGVPVIVISVVTGLIAAARTLKGTFTEPPKVVREGWMGVGGGRFRSP